MRRQPQITRTIRPIRHFQPDPKTNSSFPTPIYQKMTRAVLAAWLHKSRAFLTIAASGRYFEGSFQPGERQPFGQLLSL
jgi:hypothetical protein